MSDGRTMNTPECSMLTLDEYWRRKPAPKSIRVEMNKYGMWRVVDDRKAWDIQMTYRGYWEACLMRDALMAYEKGDVETAGKLSQWSANGEWEYRR